MDEDSAEIEALRELFPLRMRGLASTASLELLLGYGRAEVGDTEPDEIWMPIQLVTYDPDGSVRDVREQPVLIAKHPAMLADRARVQACMQAHAEILAEVARKARADDSLLPRELLFVGELLALRNAENLDHFTKALLARKRLGALLG